MFYAWIKGDSGEQSPTAPHRTRSNRHQSLGAQSYGSEGDKGVFHRQGRHRPAAAGCRRAGQLEADSEEELEPQKGWSSAGV